MENSILIILAYYDRPRILQNSLYSIILADHHYKNWELAVIDDGSTIPCKPIVESILKKYSDKITYYHTGPKTKEGSKLGEYENIIMEKSNADICFSVCDDDALHPYYLKNLNEYFNKNPDVNSCYSNLILYNPSVEPFLNHLDMSIWRPDFQWNGWNRHKNPMNGCFILDGSQMAWRMQVTKEKKCWFEPLAFRAQDASFLLSLYNNCGLTHYTGFVSQFKGVFPGALSSLWGWNDLNSDSKRFQWIIENSHVLDQSSVQSSQFKKHFVKLY